MLVITLFLKLPQEISEKKYQRKSVCKMINLIIVYMVILYYRSIPLYHLYHLGMITWVNLY